ncbi:MAG: hypothetical protein J2P36_32825 [Ktedonobacteraceae bacterium]|nr:hypothetical protein [Ktedonobacteraceae bacterium]
MAQRTRSRPVGVTIIATLLGIAIVLNALTIIFLLTQARGGVGGGNLLTAFVITLSFGGVFFLAELLLVWGILMLKSWAYWITIVVVTLQLVNGIVNLFSGNAIWWLNILSIMVMVIILGYLLRDREVRQAFRVL